MVKRCLYSEEFMTELYQVSFERRIHICGYICEFIPYNPEKVCYRQNHTVSIWGITKKKIHKCSWYSKIQPCLLQPPHLFMYVWAQIQVRKWAQTNIITRKNKPSAPGAELKIMCLFLPCCMKLDLIHSTNSSLFQNISNFQTWQLPQH